MTGNVGGGAPAINALVETIEGFIGGRAMVEMKSELGARGLVAEAPMPTYGYLRKDEFLYRRKDGDLINGWAIDALRELAQSDRHGRHTGVQSFMRQIAIRQACSCLYRMRYSGRIKLKMSQWGNMDELQIDKVALQRDILIRQNESERTEKDLEEFDRKFLSAIEERCEPGSEEDSDISTIPLIRYGEWRAIEAGYNEEERKRSHLEEQRSAENMAGWTNWQKSQAENSGTGWGS